MFVEELTKIKECETSADELQKQAKLDAAKLVDDAKLEAAHIVEEAELEAKTVYDKLVAEGTEISDKNYEDFLAKTREECKAMEVDFEAKKQGAIDLIVERIVNSSVNN
ncbi:MAG: hypothetical protein MJ145_01585 [Clostridia bacterium]|nr:hypothetical protein [Clostridia bacterium]